MSGSIYGSYTLDYIRSMAPAAARAGALLGVSQNAILGGVAEELNSRLTGPWLSTGGFPLQILADTYALGRANWGGHTYLARNYQESLGFTTEQLANKSISNVVQNPVLIDIGPGNIQVRTAITLLRDYYSENPSNDPLNLRRYENDYASLVRDLVNQRSETTVNIAALMAREAQTFFQERTPNRWNNASTAEKEGLIVAYYNRGREKMNEEADRAALNGEEYYQPVDRFGAEAHMANRDRIDTAIQDGLADPSRSPPAPLVPSPTPCFTAGTPILMADGRTKPIEDVRVGDLVLAFDPAGEQGRGGLVPRPVTRLYRNLTQAIIDLRGLHVTPGHVCLTDQGRFETIATILLRDGILIQADGAPIRARTGSKVGTVEDLPIKVRFTDQASGADHYVTLRAGIPVLQKSHEVAASFQSLAAFLAATGISIADDGALVRDDGTILDAALWPAGTTPLDTPMQRDFIVRDQKGQLFAPEWVTALRNPEVVSADIVGNVRHLIRRDTPAAAASLAISDLAFTRSMLHGFSEATRDRFESGSEWRCEGSGATALAPYRQDGWCTYNFEVRDLHTYVANDLRVHNLCNEDGAEIDPDSVTWEEDGSEIRIGFDLENGDHVEIVNNIDLDGEYRRIESATTVYRSADGQVDIAHQRVDGEDQYYRAVAGNDGRPTLVAIEADDFSAPDTSRDQPALDIEAYDINANPDGSGFEFTGTDSNGATLSVEIDPGAGDSAGFYRTEEVTFATGVTVTRNYNDEGQLVSTLTGQTTSDGGYREVETTSNGQNVERIYDAQGTLVSQGPVADGSSTFQGGMQGLASFVALTQAIQTGQPLPIAIASLGFTANIFGSTGPNGTWVAQPGLAGAGSVLSAVASVMSLQQAIRTHDAFGGLVAGASIISNSASAYASIATEALGTAVVENALFSVATDIARVMAPTAALLSIANNLRQGNYVGAALNVVGMALQYFLPPGIGAVAAAVVNIIGGQIINSLFGKKKKVPDVWGTGHFEAQADGSLVAVAAGAHGGDQNVRSLINSFISVLDSIADNANANAPNAPPEWQVGVIAQRLPRVIGNYTGQVRIRLQDNDPVTGAVRELWYGGDGYSWNELSGQSYAFRNMNEQLVTSALEAGAFAPMWEVRTAFLQSQAGLADDGLSEMQRAQQHNHRAAAPAAGAVTAAWRPIMLDLDGNGLTIIQQAASSTFFDTRGDGFIRKTAWLGGGDGFLTLDRNGDGAITTAEELFANPGVATPWQGLDSLDWIDANGDGRITATDPVFAVLRVWRDLDSDGVNDTGELSSLSDLGITAINYRRGNFDRSGLGLQAGSPELQTALAGTRTRAVNGGLLIESTDGNVSVLATTIENQDAVSPGRDRVTGGVEDVAIDILITDLLANDRIGAATAGSLSLVSVGNATNGSVEIRNGSVRFTPTANFNGTGAGFAYVVQDIFGQTATIAVDVNIAAVNDAPRVVGSVYRMQEVGVVDENGNPIVVWDAATGTYRQQTTQVVADYRSGRISVADVDDTNFTYSIRSSRPNGGTRFGTAVVNADGSWVLNAAEK